MAKNGGGCLLVVVVLAAAVGFGYYKTQNGGSEAAPAPPGSEIGGGTGRYVALGDSYTSSPKTGKQAGEPVGCARSDNNYPHLVAAEINPAEFADVSCSGAVTASITGSQKTSNGTNPPQLNAVDETTTLVTLGIGGNDVGFIGFAGECVAGSPNAAPCKEKFTAGGKDQLAAKIDATGKKVAELLKKIRGKAPKAKIIVVGYPTVLPDGEGCWPALPVGVPDVAYLRDALGDLNQTLSDTADKNDAGFADTAAPTKGHDVCTNPGTRWVEGLVATSPAIGLHPNAKGQQAMAEAVQKVIS
ncbi:SGNH/GDSL hydrolase family protein [Amycolatopsis magusensis]|uniref:SGNH/GDSL hydrolase family protein n=1 Tax=Amycolatopsis magusensis TaxID=882444 RepID=UPI003C2F1312